MMFLVWQCPKKGEQNLLSPRNIFKCPSVCFSTEESKPIHFLVVISNTMHYIFHLKFVEGLQFISASPAPFFSYEPSTYYPSHFLQSLEKNIDALALRDTLQSKPPTFPHYKNLIFH